MSTWVLNFLMFRKHNMGLDVRKLSCGVLRTTNAQTSLRIRSDLEITQLNQTRSSAAVWSVQPWPLFRPIRFYQDHLFGQMCLFGLVRSFFSVSSRLFNAVFFHVYPYQYCRCATWFGSSLGIGLDKGKSSIILFQHFSICFEHSKEPPHWDHSLSTRTHSICMLWVEKLRVGKRIIAQA